MLTIQKHLKSRGVEDVIRGFENVTVGEHETRVIWGFS